MNSGINYRSYKGSIEFSEEDSVFHGKVIGIKSTISFEGDCAQTLTEDFHNAIDEYIEHCEKVGIEPEKACLKNNMRLRRVLMNVNQNNARIHERHTGR